jgi:hypothetical protein
MLDLVLTSEHLAPHAVRCTTMASLNYFSDHLPVQITIKGVNPLRETIIERPVWGKTDMEALIRRLETNLRPTLTRRITSIPELETATEELIASIQGAIEDYTPKAKIHPPHSRPGFPEELKELQLRAQRLKHRQQSGQLRPGEEIQVLEAIKTWRQESRTWKRATF